MGARRTWGTILFVLGAILAVALALAAVWGDFEAMSYFYTGAAYEAFSGLHCPVLMSRAEVAPISATFDNPTDRAIQPYYQVKISGVAAPRGFDRQVELAPHASATDHWTVNAGDIDLGWFVMVQLTVLPFAGNPARGATCGMLVLNLGGLHAAQVLPWAVGSSLLGILAGLALREGSEPPEPGKPTNLRNGLRAAGIAALLGMLTGFLGAWLLGLIFSAIAILLGGILLRIATT